MDSVLQHVRSSLHTGPKHRVLLLRVGSWICLPRLLFTPRARVRVEAASKSSRQPFLILMHSCADPTYCSY